MTPLDGALWLVRRGFAVFPVDHPGNYRCAGIGRGHDPETCQDRGKHPTVPFTRAHTVDEAQVWRWFEGQAANVGVAVGARPGPDEAHLVVVDSDRPGALEDAAAAFGYRHTPTMRVTTAKGHHDYYWAPASVRLGNSLGQLRGKFDGDIRSGNAYVIGPGSVHATGVLYEVADPEQPPVNLPAWLHRALTEPPEQPQVQRGQAHDGSPVDSLRGLLNFVLDAPEGERNSRLYWAACRALELVRANRADGPAVFAAFVDAGRHIGLSETEAARTVRSAERAPTRTEVRA